MSPDQQCIIIHGLTEDGRTFRPSDWIERLMDSVLSFGGDRRQRNMPFPGWDRRRRHTPLVRPQMIDGARCLVVDPKLREADPRAFEFLMLFVAENRLRICAPADD